MTQETITLIVLELAAVVCFGAFIVGYVKDKAWGAYAFFAGLVLTAVCTIAALSFALVGILNTLLPGA